MAENDNRRPAVAVGLIHFCTFCRPIVTRSLSSVSCYFDNRNSDISGRQHTGAAQGRRCVANHFILFRHWVVPLSSSHRSARSSAVGTKETFINPQGYKA